MGSSLERIMFQMRNTLVCSNPNRAAILHLLKKSRSKKLQAERIAYHLGLSHRTVLYHLDVLRENGLVEVKGVRIRGSKTQRSVWGLNSDNEKISRLFSQIYDNFPQDRLDGMVKRNQSSRVVSA